MANVSTNLMSTLLNNESTDEVFRPELENAVNEVLSTEHTALPHIYKWRGILYIALLRGIAGMSLGC